MGYLIHADFGGVLVTGQTVEQLEHQLDVLNAAHDVAQELGQFTDWLNALTGADAGAWTVDDPTKKEMLGQLKAAVEKLGEEVDLSLKDGYGPLGEAAEAGDKYAGSLKSILELAEVIGKANDATGADQARYLAQMLGAVQQLTGLFLSINPVLGIFFGLYGTALESAAVGIEHVQQYVDERNAAIRSGWQGVDPQTRAEIDTESLGEAEEALQQQLNETYEAWFRAKSARDAAERRSADTDRQAALDIGARSHPDAIAAATARGSQVGGLIGSGMPANRQTMEDIRNWLDMIDGEIANANDVAQNAKGRNDEVYQAAVERAQTLTDAKYDVIEELRPVFDTARNTLETHRGSAGSGTKRRLVMIGGGGLLAGLMLLGLWFWIDDEGNITPATAPEPAESAVRESEPAEAASGSDSGQQETSTGDASEEAPSESPSPSTPPSPVPTDVPPATANAGELEGLADYLVEEGAAGTVNVLNPSGVDDSVDCSSGSPVADPASDLLGVVGTTDGQSHTVAVVMRRPPGESSQQFSWAVVIQVVSSSGASRVFLWEKHDGVESVGERDEQGNVSSPADVDIEIVGDSVVFRFPADSTDPAAAVFASAFSTPAEGDVLACDNLLSPLFPFPIGAGGTTAECPSDTTTGCVNGGRHTIQVQASAGPLMPTLVGPDRVRFEGQGGLVLVRVLNGCPLSGGWWASAMSPGGEFTITMTDQTTGETRTYENPFSPQAPALTDTAAFSTCP